MMYSVSDLINSPHSYLINVPLLLPFFGIWLMSLSPDPFLVNVPLPPTLIWLMSLAPNLYVIVAFHFGSDLAALEKSHKEYLEEFTPDLWPP